jgi:tRNA1(Val) A37 N6-methylase TrmN6
MAEDGKLAIVIPSEQSNSLIEEAEKAGLKALRMLDIQGNPGKPIKRNLIEFINTEKQISFSHDLLILESEPGKRTEQHIALCKDFYLKW